MHLFFAAKQDFGMFSSKYDYLCVKLAKRGYMSPCICFLQQSKILVCFQAKHGCCFVRRLSEAKLYMLSYMCSAQAHRISYARTCVFSKAIFHLAACEFCFYANRARFCVSVRAFLARLNYMCPYVFFSKARLCVPLCSLFC